MMNYNGKIYNLNHNKKQKQKCVLLVFVNYLCFVFIFLSFNKFLYYGRTSLFRVYA